jgi:hypothetical protein
MTGSNSKSIYVGLTLLSALFLTGCNSLPLSVSLGAGVVTGLGAVMPAHEIEQIYYLGSFDPQEQVPPSLYRVRVRGQASFISWASFGSGWVPAELIDSLGSSVSINKADGKIMIAKAENDQIAKLTIGRRLMQFGPEGFREVPKDHRLVIVMGSSPEDFFRTMDEALGAVTTAKAAQDSNALNRLLFEAMITVKAEKQLVEAQLEAAKDQFPSSEGKGL